MIRPCLPSRPLAGLALCLAMALAPLAAAAQSPTVTQLSLSSETSRVGEPVTLTALVDGLVPPAPGGSVSFRDGQRVIGSAVLEAMGIEFTTIAAGNSHSCATTRAGQVLCWGGGGVGQLGNGAANSSALPVRVSGISTAIAVAAGTLHSCALLASGQVQCWGRGGLGRLGNGATDDSLVPVTVSGITTATAIATGSGHSCAVLASGGVWCWGVGISGELGNGATEDSSVPVPVSGITAASAVSAGGGNTCALVFDRFVQCWGIGVQGQLGNGRLDNSSVPVPVSTINRAVAVAVGGLHACAIVASRELPVTHSVQCWGEGDGGQLGNGAFVLSSVPVTVRGIDAAATLAVGHGHGCATLTSGAVRCWGEGNSGKLGNRATTNSSIPVAVFGIGSAVAVVAGGSHSCAVMASGRAECWGFGLQGQIGNGAAISALQPLSVLVSHDGVRSVSRAVLTTSTLPLGLRVLRAVHAGTEDHAPSSSDSQRHLVHDRPDAQEQTISFAGIAAQTWAPDRTVPLPATASSGLAVAFASLTPAVCGVAGTSASLLRGGTCRIEARQPGDAAFLPAVPRVQGFEIGRAEQTIRFFGLDLARPVGEVFALTSQARATSGLPVVYASRTPAVCTVTSNTARFVARGTCTIEARQAGDARWQSAGPEAQSFAVVPPTVIDLTGPATVALGQPLPLRARVTSPVGTPGGTVFFRRVGADLGTTALDTRGVAEIVASALPLGTYSISVFYSGTPEFAPATSELLSVTVAVLDVGFLGGGAVFAQTAACAPLLGEQPHPVTVRYSPSELGGLPSGVSIVWRTGSEHLALWGPMAASAQFFGGAGRGTWTRFVFYPTRPLIRVVGRQITAPGGADLARAREVSLRLRVQNFGAVAGCSATLVAVLRRE